MVSIFELQRYLHGVSCLFCNVQGVCFMQKYARDKNNFFPNLYGSAAQRIQLGIDGEDFSNHIVYGVYDQFLIIST